MNRPHAPNYFVLPLQISQQAWTDLNLRHLPLTEESYLLDLQHIALQLRQRGVSRASAGHLGLLGLLNQVFRTILQRNLPRGANAPSRVTGAFIRQFPPHPRSTPVDLEPWWGETNAKSRTLLAELIILALQNDNPAAGSLALLHNDALLQQMTSYRQFLAGVKGTVDPHAASPRQSLLEQLARPLRAAPESLADQLAWVASHWQHLLPEDLLRTIPLTTALWLEEQQVRGGGPGPVRSIELAGGNDEPEAFSIDADWMPDVVLQAKSCYVWLDQLSRRYAKPVERLDQIPDTELQRLAECGINSLWLIGLWERSPASDRLKQLQGKTDALASAYSLYDYGIAADLGGEDALRELRHKAARYGIRLCGDVVPNHTGLYSRWIKEHPDWFIHTSAPPYVDYHFTGPELSPDPELSLTIEDGYWNHSNAAVVFRHIDRRDNRVRYIYHGNDGTHLPWNDTAQLDYLNPAVREAMIGTVVDVARRFPIIRFDAAMTLAKKHFQRLWYPQPGGGAGVPSRSVHAMDKEDFEQRYPVEFWREVVDRVAAEAPGTLLIAEAFWLMEGFFVRTLGMHRVYNSSFMNMLKMEDNGKFRQSLQNILRFNPAILQRFVNFMNNPDEATAVAQFGKGDKYFAVATLLATLPGLPLIGHGQLEGLEEKYGMEFRRAQLDEEIDGGFWQHHEAAIFPLLRHRRLFSGAEQFWLLEFDQDGTVCEDVIAFANRRNDETALVVVHNRQATVRGTLRHSTEQRVDGEDGPLERRGLLATLGLTTTENRLYALRNQQDGHWHLHHSRRLERDGLPLALGPYAHQVYLEIRAIDDRDGDWNRLCRHLEGRGVSDLDLELLAMRHADLHTALRKALSNPNTAAATEWFEAWRCHVDPESDTKTVSARWISLLKKIETEEITASNRGLLRVAALFQATLGSLRDLSRVLGRFGFDLPLRELLTEFDLSLLKQLYKLTPRPRELVSGRLWVRLLADQSILELLGCHRWGDYSYLCHEALERLVHTAPLYLDCLVQADIPFKTESLRRSGTFLLRQAARIDDRLDDLLSLDFPPERRPDRTRQTPLQLLFVAPEVTPFAKSGGLADVAGSLPQALQQLGIDVRIVMPYYRLVRQNGYKLPEGKRRITVARGGLTGKAGLRQTTLGSVPVYMIDFPAAFDRPGLYAENGRDYPDNDLRYGFFCRATLELAKSIDFRPDIIHVHDWQTALIPLLLTNEYATDPFFAMTATHLTIHNLGYQGLFPADNFQRLQLPDELFRVEGIEYYGQFSLLKGGIRFADQLTTVSPAYAREILTPEFGHGFETILAKRRDDLHGILNGLDIGYWDPAQDVHLSHHFSPQNLRGKTHVKRRLQHELDLQVDPTIPLAVMVTRLDRQKGVDLVTTCWQELLQRGLQLVILGSGDPDVELQLQQLCRETPNQTRFIDGFNEPLAHRIYGGGDLFLMPSRYEPCGLSQMIALRYGTVPIARRTGGLADTIIDCDERVRGGNGWLFDAPCGADLLETIDRALEAFGQRRTWLGIMRRGMQNDFSWNRSAQEYDALYQQIVENGDGGNKTGSNG